MFDIISTIITPLSIITFSALAMCQLFDRKFYETLPTALCSTLAILYISYAFNMLFYGKLLVCTIAALITILAIIRLAKNKTFSSFAKENILTPTMFVYLLLVVVFAFFAQNKLVGLWDELRLWGAYPKALHTFETLQLGENAILYPLMQSYVPGMTMLGYFFTSFSNVFNESVLFFLYSFLGMAFLLPLTKNLKWSKWHNVVLVVFVMVFMPHIIYKYIHYAYYYQSLYIDAMLGICFGYCFWLASENSYTDNFKTFAFSVALICLLTLKDTGFFFVLICIAVSFVYLPFFKKNKKIGSFITRAAVTSIAAIGAYLLWSYTKQSNGIYNHLGYAFDAAMLKSLYMTLKKMVFTPIPYLILFPMLIEFIHAIKTKTNTSTKNWIRIIRIIAYAGFIIGYTAVFKPSISREGIYPSLYRYTGTIILCELYFFSIFCVNLLKNKDFIELIVKNKKTLKNIIRITTAILIVAVSVFLVNDFSKYDGNIYTQADEIALQITDEIQNDGSEIVYIYYASQNDPMEDSLLHHRIYFNLIDEKIMIKNFYIDTDILKYKPDSFLSKLVDEGYDYVYLLNSNEQFISEYSHIFASNITTESNNKLYAIETDNNETQLISID